MGAEAPLAYEAEAGVLGECQENVTAAVAVTQLVLRFAVAAVMHGEMSSVEVGSQSEAIARIGGMRSSVSRSAAVSRPAIVARGAVLSTVIVGKVSALLHVVANATEPREASRDEAAVAVPTVSVAVDLSVLQVASVCVNFVLPRAVVAACRAAEAASEECGVAVCKVVVPLIQEAGIQEAGIQEAGAAVPLAEVVPSSVAVQVAAGAS